MHTCVFMRTNGAFLRGKQITRRQSYLEGQPTYAWLCPYVYPSCNPIGWLTIVSKNGPAHWSKIQILHSGLSQRCVCFIHAAARL